MKRFGALILAAGESRRIGYPKALLRWEDQSFLEKIIETLRASRVDEIHVVVSTAGEALLRQHLHLPGVRLVVNPDPSRGQFSSLQEGLRNLDADVVLICLVDHPKVSASVVFELKEACIATDALAVIPRFQGRRGHPIAIKKDLISLMLDAPAGASAKEVLRTCWDKVMELDTKDAGILADIDTALDYEEFLGEEFPHA
ncbi:MAG TPA: nucleotidyltransferase family protein [Acidobacteriota bacterium]|jgi:molybdenum cofactor cytidylyltransferase